MTDLNRRGTQNDIDNNFIDIDVIPCFNDIRQAVPAVEYGAGSVDKRL
jgi:hypothetical protein